MKNEMKADHERIWLEPKCCASPYDGRLWCEDKGPMENCEHGVEPTEYVRADLARAAIEATTVKSDGLVEEAEFLCSRLVELECDILDDEVGRQYYGHVAPSRARLQAILSEHTPEAADTITTLKGEIERLREEIVELWHKTDQTETRELHEVLGMTFEQYGAWLTASQALGSTDNVG